MNTRIEQLKRRFREAFPGSEPELFSAPGRTELGGNHTDHQHGRVLCAAVELDILACAAPNGLDRVRIHSEGYAPLEVDIKDLSPDPNDYNTSAALVRGVAAGIRNHGFAPGGFDACITSAVPAGSGLSSSAAFEILLGVLFNHFFCGDTLKPTELAKIGQYAENVYFGKPCGLMDQMASALGGIVAIDFANPDAPLVQKIDYDFAEAGYCLCIVDTRSDHGDLTEDYAAITREMGAVAQYFGKRWLRDVDETAFRAALPALRTVCGDRAVLRAMHFFAENRRAALEAEALEAGDFERFLSLVNESGFSSALLLENLWSPAAPQRQAMTLAIAVGRELLGGTGAIRVHGGGFAGTVQAFVPRDKLSDFQTGMEAVFGIDCCHALRVRSSGGCVIH